MIAPLKLTNSDNSRIFFFSDFHYNHDRDFIYKARHFNNVQHHNDTLVDRWNYVICNNDIVFHLGDMTFMSDENTIIDLLNNLRGHTIYLMPGNHTSGYRQLYKSNDHHEIDEFGRIEGTNKSVNKNYYFIPNYFETIINKQSIVLCHYPILSWNGMGKGSQLLFGHCHHSLENTKWVADNYLVGKCMEVSPESILLPISFNEVQTYMHFKKIITPDHHNQKTKNPF